jgi:hypothetical protein
MRPETRPVWRGTNTHTMEARMPHPLGPDALARLRTYTTPTLSNAIETFNVRPKTAGFTAEDIRAALAR